MPSKHYVILIPMSESDAAPLKLVRWTIALFSESRTFSRNSHFLTMSPRRKKSHRAYDTSKSDDGSQVSRRLHPPTASTVFRITGRAEHKHYCVFGRTARKDICHRVKSSCRHGVNHDKCATNIKKRRPMKVLALQKRFHSLHQVRISGDQHLKHRKRRNERDRLRKLAFRKCSPLSSFFFSLL